jgi:hypothetical protein
MTKKPGRNTIGGQSKTSQSAFAAAERARQACDLRIAGATLPQIAAALGYADASGAHRAITRALDRLPSEADEELRQIQHLRIEAAIMAMWPKIQRGEERSILALVRLLQRESRLYGLDAPAKVEIGLEDMIRDMAQRAAEKFPDLDEAEVVAMAEELMRDSRQ